MLFFILDWPKVRILGLPLFLDKHKVKVSLVFVTH
jgi:hypothetical protein